MKITAVGDFLIQENFSTDYPDFNKIKDYIGKGDARFFNFETTINKEGTCPSCEFSGGSYLRVEKDCLETAKKYGFNLINFNNNHSFDFTQKGFESTLTEIEKSGLVNAGTGFDLRSASKPQYFDTKSGKIAFISVCDTLEAGMVAGNKNSIYVGRPGVNGLRLSRVSMVTKEQMEALKDIAKQTGINKQDDLDREDGYLPEFPEGYFEMAGAKFQVADKPSFIIKPNEADEKRILDSIKEAKENADIVIVSYHTHSVEDDIENVPVYLGEFFHKLIDNGANAIIGHGPHLIRGIEIYKGAPIFHSLGDFVLQLNSIHSAAPDFCEKLGLDADTDIKTVLDVRSNGGKRGLMYNRRMFETFIPFIEFDGKKLKSIELLPLELGFDLPYDHKYRGVPKIATDLSFIERLKELSRPFGTEITVANGIAKVKI